MPILLLDATTSQQQPPQYSHIMCHLPIRHSWAPFDLTSFSGLAFSIRIYGESTAKVRVQLATEGIEENYVFSEEILLSALTLETLQNCVIPLSLFQSTRDFPLHKTRIIQFTADSSIDCIELSKLVLLRLLPGLDDDIVLIENDGRQLNEPVDNHQLAPNQQMYQTPPVKPLPLRAARLCLDTTVGLARRTLPQRWRDWLWTQLGKELYAKTRW